MSYFRSNHLMAAKVMVSRPSAMSPKEIIAARKMANEGACAQDIFVALGRDKSECFGTFCNRLRKLYIRPFSKKFRRASRGQETFMPHRDRGVDQRNYKPRSMA